MRKVSLLVSGFLIVIASWSQEPRPFSSSDIYLKIKKLNVLGSVLYIAAHPDDENNGLLPYLAKEKLYRTAYLSLTRGDGGQNLIGNEQGVELGLIRTQELLAARRIDGSEQYFSTAYEFGYSKSADEALKIWNKEKVLSDVVWVIRKYQPDIIIARFPGDARAGHGHHAASSILANEAFYAAADSTKFPEQFKYGVKPWKAKRILWNTFNFGGNNTTNENQLKVDAGVFNPLLGASYGEIGGEARTMHKSQGEGRPKRKGSIMEYFAVTGGDSAKNDIMEGVDISWNRVENGKQFQNAIQTIIQQFDFNYPEKSVPALIDLYKEIQRTGYSGQWKIAKLKELQNLILECSGIFFEATTDNEYAVSGENMNVTFFANKRNTSLVKLESFGLNAYVNNTYNNLVNWDLPQNQNNSFTKTFQVPPEFKFSQPYWLEKAMENGRFNVDDQTKIGNAQSDAAFTASFTFKLDSTISFVIKKPVEYKYLDPVKGEIYQPFIIIPPMIISVSPDNILTNIKSAETKSQTKSIQLNYKSNFSAKAIPTSIFLQSDTSIVFKKDTVIDFEAGHTYHLDIPIKSIRRNILQKDLSALVEIEIGGKKKNYTHYLRAIKYDHIPDIHYLYKDNVKMIDEEIKIVGKKVGYINGAGDKVPEALLQMGYNVQFLSEADVTDENLKQFDAVVVGIRAYNIYDWLTNKNDILSRYVFNGGSLIVQYIRSNQIGNKNVTAGPYPFTINTASRITDENAKINFLQPNHPALNYPNKITEKDFENWVQERSTYQADKFDTHFDALLGMHDANEKESNGSLITAKYGKGNFSYVSLVLFRQLPAGNAGAYRILANLVALPKNK
jgi:LmbE family N-acetylglucosaminyl deacetylase